MRIAAFIGSFCLFLVGFIAPAGATHIIGGEYTLINFNQAGETGMLRYHVEFRLYMDCIQGDPQAIQRENDGYFVLYSNTAPKQVIDTYRVPKQPLLSQIIPPGFKNECINNPPSTCLLMNVYKFDVVAPNIAGGYYLATNNCCRNGSIVNINNPNTTGASYYTYLPPLPLKNNSAVFKNFPPQIICINNPFVYDHSATDPDGDSLSYEFGPAYNAQVTTSGGQIFADYTPPPYNPVNYSFPFNAVNPMGGNPRLQINPATGVITGTPTLAGRYVVAVYCHEWRNGTVINTTVREFQFVVTNCSKAVIANIPQYSEEFNTYIVECSSLTVHFDNISEGGFRYFWDFGVENRDDDTSDEFSPTFTYPDTGRYIVKLVVNRGSTCPDSISRYVKTFPSFVGFFNYDGLPCPNSPISFRDSSQSTTNAANWWQWSFGDGDTSYSQNPTHFFREGGAYNVVLVARNPRNCVDTVSQTVDIEKFRAFAGNDTVIVKGETLNFNALGGVQYLWTPATFLSNPNIGNPSATYPDTGHFAYNVFVRSINGCEGNDSIRVWVVDQSSVFVPTGFSPNGDGRNETLRPLGVGYRNINYFRVYNRFGEQVFYTTKFGEGWDGVWKGVPQDIGTYYWVLSITNRFGKEEIIKGDSALIR